MGSGKGYPPEWPAVSLQTKIDAGFRCVRCRHPNGRLILPNVDEAVYAKLLEAEWGIPVQSFRFYTDPIAGIWLRHHLIPCDEQCTHDPEIRDHRILTVHHLDGVKPNLAWWNLAALCQRCHLVIQGRVDMWQTYAHPHTPWFYPYVAGFYAKTILGQDLTREEVDLDLLRLLSAGQPHLEHHYRAVLAAPHNGGTS